MKSFSRLLASAMLPTFFAMASPVAAQAPNVAALGPEALSGLCLDKNDLNPARRIMACTRLIEERKVQGRALTEALTRRAETYKSLGETSKATADYRAVIALLDSTIGARNDPTALFARGSAHRALGDVDRALADYDEAIRLDTKYASALVARGTLLASLKAEVRKAIADFDQVLALNPSSVEALTLRGDAYGLLGDHGRALADLDRAVTLEPMNARAHVLQGLTLARLGNHEKAYVAYSKAIAIEPQNVEALVNRSAIAAYQGDSGSAIRDLDIAIASEPGNALAHYNRGYARFAAKEFDAAISDYSAAIALDPRLGWAYLNRCLTRAVLGKDLPQALADCDEAMKLLPENPEVRETRGFVFLKLNDADLALLEYDSVLVASPNRPLALYGRGLARARRGDVKGGIADKEAARALFADIGREFTPYGLQ